MDFPGAVCTLRTPFSQIRCHPDALPFTASAIVSSCPDTFGTTDTSYYSHSPYCNPISWVFLALFAPFARHAILLATILTGFCSWVALPFPPPRRNAVQLPNLFFFPSLSISTPIISPRVVISNRPSSVYCALLPCPFPDAVLAVTTRGSVGIVAGGTPGSGHLWRAAA